MMTKDKTQPNDDDGGGEPPIFRLVALILNEGTRRGATAVRLTKASRRVIVEHELAGEWVEADSPTMYL